MLLLGMMNVFLLCFRTFRVQDKVSVLKLGVDCNFLQNDNGTFMVSLVRFHVFQKLLLLLVGFCSF